MNRPIQIFILVKKGIQFGLKNLKVDQLQRRYIFDDRGYLSAIRYFDDQGEASYQEYLTINGDCVLHEDLKNGRVTVSKRYQHHYQQTKYNNMAQLIEEKFQAMIAQQIHEDDHVIVASDARHNSQIANHIPAKSLSYSFFKNRK